MISAIILSSNKNTDNAQQKAALQQLIDALTLSRVLDVVIVSRDDDKNIGIVELSPILKGLDLLEQKELHGIMVCSPDQKLCSQAVFVDILHLFWTKHKKIIMPMNQSSREFPIIISNELFDVLRKEPAGSTLASFMKKHSHDILEVEMNENGIIRKPKPLTQPEVEESNG